MAPPIKHPVIDGHKTCSACGVSKPVADFYEVKKGTGKLFSACKPCIIAQQRTNPNVTANRRAWQATHRDRVRAANNAQYAKHPERWSARERQRWINDPEWRMRKTAQTNNARRGRAYAALIDDVTIEEIAERDAWICKLCGQPVDRELLKSPKLARKHPGYPTIDHIQPFSVASDGCRLKPGETQCPHECRGGFTVLTNLQLAHGGCNKHKGMRFTALL